MPFRPPQQTFNIPEQAPQVDEESRFLGELLKQLPITGPLSQMSDALPDIPGSGALLGGPMAAVSTPMRLAIDAIANPAKSGKGIFNTGIIDFFRRTAGLGNKRLDKLTPDEQVRFIRTAQKEGIPETGVRNFSDVELMRKGINSRLGAQLTKQQQADLASALQQAQIRKASELNDDVNFIEGFQNFIK
jgi:hypothetical protein